MFVQTKLESNILTNLQTRLQILSPSAGGVYTGAINAIRTIRKTEGTKTLWRGITSVFVGAGMPARNISRRFNEAVETYSDCTRTSACNVFLNI